MAYAGMLLELGLFIVRVTSSLAGKDDAEGIG